MKITNVKNQQELEAALAAGEYPVCVGNECFGLPSGAKADATGSSTVTAYDSSTVRAYDSSTVTAYGSSTVTAYDSSTVRATGSSTVRAYGSCTVRAYDSSTVTAYGSSTVTAYDSSTVTAGRFAAIHNKSGKASVTGGVVIVVPPIETAQDWCDVYGVDVTDGVALVYKGVGDDFKSPHGADYTPGTITAAPDWDGGEMECGKGLHFSPSPAHTLDFNRNATRFIACPVALSDIAVHKDANSPEKIKARGLYAPCWEVDIHGRRVEASAVSSNKAQREGAAAVKKAVTV